MPETILSITVLIDKFRKNKPLSDVQLKRLLKHYEKLIELISLHGPIMKICRTYIQHEYDVLKQYSDARKEK